MSRCSNLSLGVRGNYYFKVVERLVVSVIYYSSIFFCYSSIEKYDQYFVLKVSTSRSTSFINFNLSIPWLKLD